MFPAKNLLDKFKTTKSLINAFNTFFLFYFLVWFKVKLHVKDAKTIMDKKKYVAFWLERYAKKEPGMPLTVVFDMAESGLGNIVSPSTCFFFSFFF